MIFLRMYNIQEVFNRLMCLASIDTNVIPLEGIADFVHYQR